MLYLPSETTTPKAPFYNVLIIGYTGIGKTSLVNYIFGVEMAKISSTPVPDTQETTEYIDVSKPDFLIKLIDTKGSELNTYKEWENNLNVLLKQHSIEKPATEWFHTILYCINAAGDRVQEADILNIKRLLNENYQVVVVLTKADYLKKEKIIEYNKVFQNNIEKTIRVLPVCSEKNSDIITKTPFGKREIIAQIKNNFIESICIRLPKHCDVCIKTNIDKWKEEQIRLIREKKKQNISLENLNYELENIDRELEKSLELLNRESLKVIEHKLLEVLNVYGKILKNIDNNLKIENSTILKNSTKPDITQYLLDISRIITDIKQTVENPSKSSAIREIINNSFTSVALSGAIGVAVTESAKIAATNAVLTFVYGAAAVPVVGGIATGLAVLSPLAPFLLPISIGIPVLKFIRQRNKKRDEEIKAVESRNTIVNKAIEDHVNKAFDSLVEAVEKEAIEQERHVDSILEEFRISLANSFKT